MPLARLPFGKTIVLPGAVQWLSSIAWDALVGLFGGQAAQLLFHVPFWLGVAIVLVLEGIVSVFGYEFVHRLQEWGSAILIVLFLVLTVKIFQHHVVLPHNTVHGAALVGAFVLMVTISLSEGISWASYASDYSRYMKPELLQGGHLLVHDGRPDRVVRVDRGHRAGRGQRAGQPDGGRGARPDGRRVPRRAGADRDRVRRDRVELDERLTGSLAFQALGARVRRPIIAAVVAVLAFAAILCMNAANTSGRFENLLLFTSYWIAPFCAIVMIDWHYNRDKYRPSVLRRALVSPSWATAGPRS